VTPFRPLAPDVAAALEEEAQRYAAFLGLPLRLTVRDPS
jgi:hypothetical protein